MPWLCHVGAARSPRGEGSWRVADLDDDVSITSVRHPRVCVSSQSTFLAVKMSWERSLSHCDVSQTCTEPHPQPGNPELAETPTAGSSHVDHTARPGQARDCDRIDLEQD